MLTIKTMKRLLQPQQNIHQRIKGLLVTFPSQKSLGKGL